MYTQCTAGRFRAGPAMLRAPTQPRRKPVRTRQNVRNACFARIRRHGTAVPSWIAACLARARLAVALAATSACMFVAPPADAATIFVPTDQPTIQAGVTAALPGDMVVIQPGLYTGPGNYDVDFLGKAITVTSQAGAALTVINCLNLGRAFIFQTGEGPNSVLSDVTIVNGFAQFNGGGAIFCDGSSPTIAGNTIQLCDANPGGGAIRLLDNADATITDNTIYHNNSYSDGGAISITNSDPLIEGNIIQNNSVTSPGLSGGGIAVLSGTSTPTIRNNQIIGNTSPQGGGGLYFTGGGTVEYNIICGNSATMSGGGVSCNNTSNPAISHNTIIHNSSPTGAGIRFNQSNSMVEYNIIAFNINSSGVSCNAVPEPTLKCNDLYGNDGGDAICGIDGGGNFMLDPLFDPAAGICGGELLWGSPCLKDNTACNRYIGADSVFTPVPPEKPDIMTVYYPSVNEVTCTTTSTDTFRLAWFNFDSGTMGWITKDLTSRGDFADLYPGLSVVQEDVCTVNTTNLWGFFDDPNVTNYDCHIPPFPGQGAVPFLNADYTYASNEIWSPPINIAVGAGNEYRLLFDVYRDLPFDNLIFYHWRLRDRSGGGPWSDWKSNGTGYYGCGPEIRDWVRQNEEIGHLIDPNADEIQIALGVSDLCYYFCGVLGTGACHSHAPLFDNVHVLRIDVAGPRWIVRPIDLFQDNFAQDGTLVGGVRADAAIDIRPPGDLTIDPGDSVVAGIVDPIGLAVDANTGVGPAVYCYVSVWPAGQVGKTGPDLEAPETRGAVGTRYPYISTFTSAGGDDWFCYRMDNVVDGGGSIVPDRYCFDLADNVLTPGDTVCYFFCAENTAGLRTYFHNCRVTDDIEEAAVNPIEFTCLPAGGWARGGDILYIDDYDGHGAQPIFDQAFISMGLDEYVDRYDVLGPEYRAGNGLGSRVKSIQQLTDCYRKIIWSSGDLGKGLVGNATIGVEKSDDFGVLYDFLDKSPNMPGVYFTGDNVAEEWNKFTGGDAVTLRATYINFDLVTGDHILVNEPVSPCVSGVIGGCFSTLGVPEQLIASAACNKRSRFDVFSATATDPEMENAATGRYYVVSQTTPNGAASVARVMLTGFSFHRIASKPLAPPPVAYKTHLHSVLTWLANVVSDPVGIPAPELPSVDYLASAYPNPFNPTTTIRYGLREPTDVTIQVFNTAGQLVRTLVDEFQTPGEDGFAVQWDGHNDRGDEVASGVYFYRMNAGRFVESRKVVLLK